MKLLLDTSFLYALDDTKDTNHAPTVNYLQSIAAGELYLPLRCCRNYATYSAPGWAIRPCAIF